MWLYDVVLGSLWVHFEVIILLKMLVILIGAALKWYYNEISESWFISNWDICSPPWGLRGSFFLKKEKKWITIALYSEWGWMRDPVFSVCSRPGWGPCIVFLLQEDRNILNSKQALYRIASVYFPLLPKTRCHRPSIWWEGLIEDPGLPRARAGADGESLGLLQATSPRVPETTALQWGWQPPPWPPPLCPHPLSSPTGGEGSKGRKSEKVRVSEDRPTQSTFS